MVDFVGRLLFFFDAATRRQVALLFLLMLGGALLEMTGIALTIPILQVTLTPAADLGDGLMARLGALLHNVSPLVLGGGLFAFFAAKNLALIGITWVQNHIVQLSQAGFAERLFATYMTRSYVEHMGQNSAEVLRNITYAVPNLFANGLLALIVLSMEAMLVGAAALVLVMVEPLATAAAALVLGSTMVALYAVTRTRQVVWSHANKVDAARIIQVVNEGTAAFKEIRVLGREAEFIAQFRRPTLRTAHLRVRMNTVGQLPRLVGEIAILATILAVVGVVAVVQGRDLSAAMPILGAFAAAALRIMPSVNRIVVSAGQMRQCMPILDDLRADYRRIPAAAPAAPATTAEPLSFADSIVVDGVSFAYPGADGLALDDVTLTIARGQSVALVGASGAGKSTLADILLGLLEPSRGRVLVDGADIRTDHAAWCRRLGYVPQAITLLDASVRQNIALGVPPAEIDDERVMRAARMAQVADVITTLPGGLDAMLGERGVRLSGGQRQRIGIARALYHDPDVLVLDEATSALDNLTEDEFSRAFEDLRGKKTIVIIAHRLTTVRKCDRLFFFVGGRIADAGTFDDLAQRNAEFRRVTMTERPIGPMA